MMACIDFLYISLISLIMMACIDFLYISLSFGDKNYTPMNSSPNYSFGDKTTSKLTAIMNLP